MPKKSAKTTFSKKALEAEVRKLREELREVKNQAEMSRDLEERADKKYKEISDYPRIAYVLAYIALEEHTVLEVLEKFDLIYEQQCHEGGIDPEVERALSKTLSSVVEDMVQREPEELDNADDGMASFLTAIGLGESPQS